MFKNVRHVKCDAVQSCKKVPSSLEYFYQSHRRERYLNSHCREERKVHKHLVILRKMPDVAIQETRDSDRPRGKFCSVWNTQINFTCTRGVFTYL